jgi:hypothetical protein
MMDTLFSNSMATQNQWIFGLFPSILETRKHDISETDPVPEMLCFLVSRILGNGKNKIETL